LKLTDFKRNNFFIKVNWDNFDFVLVKNWYNKENENFYQLVYIWKKWNWEIIKLWKKIKEAKEKLKIELVKKGLKDKTSKKKIINEKAENLFIESDLEIHMPKSFCKKCERATEEVDFEWYCERCNPDAFINTKDKKTKKESIFKFEEKDFSNITKEWDELIINFTNWDKKSIDMNNKLNLKEFQKVLRINFSKYIDWKNFLKETFEKARIIKFISKMEDLGELKNKKKL